MIQGQLILNKISSNSTEAFSLFEKSNYGEKVGSKVEYSPVEALFLLENNKISIKSNNKKISFIDLLKKTKRIDKRIDTKLAIYSDLRNKGYIAKSALKFGADFRVYNKGVRPSEDHARWLLIASKENEKLDYNDFAAKNRIANSTKKRLLIAILDDEGDVSYYETSWIKT
jgi:tRNA-intron endonuclease